MQPRPTPLQIGMFSFTGLTPKQVENMTNKASL